MISTLLHPLFYSRFCISCYLHELRIFSRDFSLNVNVVLDIIIDSYLANHNALMSLSDTIFSKYPSEQAAGRG